MMGAGGFIKNPGVEYIDDNDIYDIDMDDNSFLVTLNDWWDDTDDVEGDDEVVLYVPQNEEESFEIESVGSFTFDPRSFDEDDPNYEESFLSDEFDYAEDDDDDDDEEWTPDSELN